MNNQIKKIKKKKKHPQKTRKDTKIYIAKP